MEETTKCFGLPNYPKQHVLISMPIACNLAVCFKNRTKIDQRQRIQPNCDAPKNSQHRESHSFTSKRNYYTVALFRNLCVCRRFAALIPDSVGSPMVSTSTASKHGQLFLYIIATSTISTNVIWPIEGGGHTSRCMVPIGFAEAAIHVDFEMSAPAIQVQIKHSPIYTHWFHNLLLLHLEACAMGCAENVKYVRARPPKYMWALMEILSKQTHKLWTARNAWTASCAQRFRSFFC